MKMQYHTVWAIEGFFSTNGHLLVLQAKTTLEQQGNMFVPTLSAVHKHSLLPHGYFHNN